LAKAAKKKIRRNISRGIVHIKSTFNNTVISLTDSEGNALMSQSGGTVGYKGSR